MGITYYELNDIIENKKIKTVFQPIISLRDSSVLGYEALSRITDNNKYFSIEELFDFSIAENRTWDLEYLCRTTALETAYVKLNPPIDKKLFLIIMIELLCKNSATGEIYTKKYILADEAMEFISVINVTLLIDITKICGKCRI